MYSSPDMLLRSSNNSRMGDPCFAVNGRVRIRIRTFCLNYDQCSNEVLSYAPQ